MASYRARPSSRDAVAGQDRRSSWRDGGKALLEVELAPRQEADIKLFRSKFGPAREVSESAPASTPDSPRSERSDVVLPRVENARGALGRDGLLPQGTAGVNRLSALGQEQSRTGRSRWGVLASRYSRWALDWLKWLVTGDA